MAPLQEVNFAEGDQDPRGEKRTRSSRKKKEKKAETPEWDASSGKWRSSRSKGRGLRIAATCLGAGAAIAAVVGSVYLLMKAVEVDESRPDLAPEVTQDQFDNLVKTPLLLTDEEFADPVELPAGMRRSEADFCDLAQPLAERFLSAKRIEDILSIVHDPEAVGQKIRAYYPKGVIEPLGISKFNSSGQVSYKENFAAVTITTSDYETKQMAFIEDAEGLKIDWESWVAWSEMPWGEIIKKKPEKPVLVRAMLKWVDYYNYGFSDETKWRSYRLISPDGEHMIYGYVGRNSLLDQKIRPSEPNATVAVTIRIHCPAGGQTANQVIIDEYVQDGWVMTVDGK